MMQQTKTIKILIRVIEQLKIHSIAFLHKYIFINYFAVLF